MSRRPPYLFAALALLFALPAVAQLRFTTTRVSIDAAPGTESVTASFPCTNVGNKPLAIVRIRTTCGCTTASNSTDHLAPGEATTITVDMDLRIDAGRQIKAVIVEIDRAPFAYELEIEAVLPEPLKITPKHLTWVSGHQPQPRTLALIPDAGVTILDATSSDPNFTCVLRQRDDHHQLVVTPAQLDKRRFGKITVTYRLDNQTLTQKIPVSVITPPPKTSNGYWLKRLFSRD